LPPGCAIQATPRHHCCRQNSSFSVSPNSPFLPCLHQKLALIPAHLPNTFTCSFLFGSKQHVPDLMPPPARATPASNPCHRSPPWAWKPHQRACLKVMQLLGRTSYSRAPWIATVFEARTTGPRRYLPPWWAPSLLILAVRSRSQGPDCFT
jgi:hypothetical protein